MKKITPFLWFDGRAGEAARFYVSIFENSKLVRESPMDAEFVLDGQELLALNGGPQYAFTPAISLFVSCRSQAEIDRLWQALGEGGKPGRCGWLTDKFGLSWQIVPAALGRLLDDPDPAKARRVMDAMLAMTKLDVRGLERAHAGE